MGDFNGFIPRRMVGLMGGKQHRALDGSVVSFDHRLNTRSHKIEKKQPPRVIVLEESEPVMNRTIGDTG